MACNCAMISAKKVCGVGLLNRLSHEKIARVCDIKVEFRLPAPPNNPQNAR